MEGEDISFTLPGSVAPWKEDQALRTITQTETDRQQLSSSTKLSLQVSVEMPFDIRSLSSPTHEIRQKRTATKAVVELCNASSLGDGFQLLIGLAEIHVPRMWVEKLTGRTDSWACMLTFYPEFDVKREESPEIIFLLDLSCSMKVIAILHLMC